MSDNKLRLLFYCLTITGCILSSEANSYYTSFPANENGTCYKRVPYNDALIANISKGLVEVLPGSEQAGVKTSSGRGWLTIIDCCEGYVRNNQTNECETHCDDGCIGGNCTGPNVCTCEPGSRLEYGECKPQCRRGCQEHAYCFAPDVCSCEFGYREENGVCRPVCVHDCLNGDCVAPRVCRCHPGYFLNETKMCEPLCDGGCPHGRCERPGICECSQGYVHPRNTQESCEPYCPDTCKNGICHSPGICTCNQGYIRDANGSCVPECQKGCVNGKCIAPEQCLCDSGFVMNHELEKCVERTNGVSYENSASRDRTRYEQNVYRKNDEHEIYSPRPTNFPQRVIGLNETNQTRSTNGINESQKSYEFNQEHESQEPISSQRHIPGQISYTTQRTNQMQDSRGYSYRRYGNSHEQEEVVIGNPHDIQNSRQNVHVNRNPYMHPGIIQTYEPQKTITIHEINQEPEAQIIITPHSVPRTYKPYIQVFPTESTVREYENTQRIADSHQRYRVPTTNVRPSNNQMHVIPETNQFSVHTRENVAFEIEQRNISESTISLNHQDQHNNNHKSCDSESDEDDESDWYDKESYRRQHQPTIVASTGRFVTNSNTRNPVPTDYNYRPSCQFTCVNGECIGRDQCKCKDGYKLDPRNRFGNVCLPFCQGGCINGVCSAPNMCICNAGFVKEYGLKDSQKCVAVD